MPSRSERARPTRTLPTSMPSLTPGRISAMVHPFADDELDPAQRLVDLAGIGAATLSEIVLAATTATEHAGRLTDQRTGLHPAPARLLVGRDHHHRPVLDHPGDGDHGRTLSRHP